MVFKSNRKPWGRVARWGRWVCLGPGGPRRRYLRGGIRKAGRSRLGESSPLRENDDFRHFPILLQRLGAPRWGGCRRIPRCGWRAGSVDHLFPRTHVRLTMLVCNPWECSHALRTNCSNPQNRINPPPPLYPHTRQTLQKNRKVNNYLSKTP
jgi:hypothetical protein